MVGFTKELSLFIVGQPQHTFAVGGFRAGGVGGDGVGRDVGWGGVEGGGVFLPRCDS